METARVLAKRGVRIIIPARDLKKAAQVKQFIQKESPKAEILLFETDLSSFASVHKFCSDFLALDLPLNILMWVFHFFLLLKNVFAIIIAIVYSKEKENEICRNNAGIFSQNLEFSEDKIEMTFATNYLGKCWIFFLLSINKQRNILITFFSFK